jgi:hypothetical protein
MKATFTNYVALVQELRILLIPTLKIIWVDAVLSTFLLSTVSVARLMLLINLNVSQFVYKILDLF